ncbi:MAG: GGDEF domain-containing protein [Lachnospira sp.]|nr:GGDEF domain-containing protein [Lachnospira sp.]
MKTKSELDEMTGLFNKTTTEYTMDGLLKTGEGLLDVLMILDVDNFKTVNDTLGHQTGDDVIKKIANLISSTFRKSDVVGRIGGDEFCVLMNNIPSMDIAYAKLNELIQIMKYKPNLSIPEYVTLSIGVATNEQKSTSYAALFKKADDALYHAKLGGKAQYREYGIEPVKIETDERPVAILISANRNVCSVVHALLPVNIKIAEASSEKEFRQISQEDKKRAVMMYVDVSGIKGDTSTIWNQIKEIPWIEMSNVFAFCEEGNVPQYLQSLQSGVADMFKVPLDHEAFKRRTAKQLELMGYK